MQSSTDQDLLKKCQSDLIFLVLVLIERKASGQRKRLLEQCLTLIRHQELTVENQKKQFEWVCKIALQETGSLFSETKELLLEHLYTPVTLGFTSRFSNIGMLHFPDEYYKDQFRTNFVIGTPIKELFLFRILGTNGVSLDYANFNQKDAKNNFDKIEGAMASSFQLAKDKGIADEKAAEEKRKTSDEANKAKEQKAAEEKHNQFLEDVSNPKLKIFGKCKRNLISIIDSLIKSYEERHASIINPHPSRFSDEVKTKLKQLRRCSEIARKIEKRDQLEQVFNILCGIVSQNTSTNQASTETEKELGRYFSNWRESFKHSELYNDLQQACNFSLFDIYKHPDENERLALACNEIKNHGRKVISSLAMETESNDVQFFFVQNRVQNNRAIEDRLLTPLEHELGLDQPKEELDHCKEQFERLASSLQSQSSAKNDIFQKIILKIAEVKNLGDLISLFNILCAAALQRTQFSLGTKSTTGEYLLEQLNSLDIDGKKLYAMLIQRCDLRNPLSYDELARKGREAFLSSASLQSDNIKFFYSANKGQLGILNSTLDTFGKKEVSPSIGTEKKQ